MKDYELIIAGLILLLLLRKKSTAVDCPDCPDCPKLEPQIFLNINRDPPPIGSNLSVLEPKTPDGGYKLTPVKDPYIPPDLAKPTPTIPVFAPDPESNECHTCIGDWLGKGEIIELPAWDRGATEPTNAPCRWYPTEAENASGLFAYWNGYETIKAYNCKLIKKRK